MRIGVVLAAYNGEQYISKQLTSILRQTRKPDQIVISDGGSTDSTLNICREILSSAENIEFKLLESDEQLSVTNNFQKALLHCDCDYIFFADQDDVWLPNKIAVFMNVMQDNDAALTFSDAEIVDKTLQRTGVSLWRSIGYNQPDNVHVYEQEDYMFVHELLKHNVVTGMCMCVRKDLVDQVLPLNPNVLHDKWIAMHAALSFRTAAVSQKLVLYRQHQGNVIGTTSSLKKKIQKSTMYYATVFYQMEMIRKMMECHQFRNNKVKKMLRSYCCFQNQRLLFMRKKLGLFWAIKNKAWYLKTASDGKSNFIKDHIIRFTGTWLR